MSLKQKGMNSATRGDLRGLLVVRRAGFLRVPGTNWTKVHKDHGIMNIAAIIRVGMALIRLSRKLIEFIGI